MAHDNKSADKINPQSGAAKRAPALEAQLGASDDDLAYSIGEDAIESRETETKPFAHLLEPYSSGRLRRSTLVALRWGAIAGQALTLLIVGYGLKFSFPVIPAMVIVGFSVLLNILIHLTLPLDRRVSDGEALGQLGFDVLQLGALLWLTGGMNNPFALLFIAPVVTSATTLRLTVLFILFTLTTLISLALMEFSAPLPWYPGEAFALPPVFQTGLWAALMTGMAFTSLYAWRASQESRRMSEALSATEAVLAQEQKMSALGGLAAAAAHELGTPLGTIQLTAKEMTRELAAGTPLGDDARLVHEQAQRCREILRQLAYRGDEGDMMHDMIGLKALLEEVAEPFFVFDRTLDITVQGQTSPAPQLMRQAEMIYGLTNFVENAVDFASETVRLVGRWDRDHVYIDILDDGAGFDPAIRSKLGEPYVTSRPNKTGESDVFGAGGLGLGFFIAKTLLERTGGEVSFGNRKSKPGAFVRVKWKRRAIEAQQ